MNQRNRNLIILIVLLSAWGLVLVFRSPWGGPAGPQSQVTAAANPRIPAPQAAGITRLKRELLNLPRAGYPSDMHNVFGDPPPPPRPAPTAATAPPPASPPPPPPDPFQEEAKRLRYVGFLQADMKTMAFIVQGTEVHTVQMGETLAGRFRVQAVTEEAVLLSSVSGDKQVHLPLAPDAGAGPRK